MAQLSVGANTVDFYASVSAYRPTVIDMTAGNASAAYDVLHTARTYFTVLTDGATMSWASGNDYSAPAPVAAIPEPSTYALMIAGLGLVRWMGRRRKAMQAAVA